MDSLNITTVQTDLKWENIAGNLVLLQEKIAKITATDIIVLPEMFSTGFSMNAAALAEPMTGKTVAWMKEQAATLQTVIVGSVIIKEDGNYYNRMLWVQPNGELYHYDKKHLFAMGKEHETYTAGQKKGIVEYKGWKIALFVCYDLRFPVWNRNVEDYDLAIYVASWPTQRSYHWKSLLLARAIENQAYVIAVNRVGIDAGKYTYTGDSMLIDPAGEVLYHCNDIQSVEQQTITKTHLHKMRKDYPFLQDRDRYQLID